MTNLFSVRHAHSTYTPDGLGRPLSEKGFSDADRVTSILKDEKIDVVISSPNKRAIQTVFGAAQFHKKEIEIVEDFKERVLSEVPVEDFQDAIAKVWEEATFSLAGGESNNEAQERGIKAMFHILERHEGQNIVIGTHGNIMVLIMKYFDQSYDFTFWQKLGMPDIYRLSFDGTALREIKQIWE